MDKFAWQDNGTVPHFVIPKELSGTQANIIVMLPESFPNKTSNDGVAQYILEKFKKDFDNIIFGGFDSSVVSYAYVSKLLGMRIQIKTSKTVLKYYADKVINNGVELELLAPSNIDFARIYDLNRKHANFVSMFGNLNAYTYHAKYTFPAVKRVAKSYGNSKVKILVHPASTGGLSAVASLVKRDYSYSKSLIVESSKAPYFYSGKKAQHNLYGFSYGLIPLIHNIYATDYVSIVDEQDVLDLYYIFNRGIGELVKIFGKEWEAFSKVIGKLSLATVASIIASINIAKQLYLGEHENIVIIAEELAEPFESMLYDTMNLEYIEKSIIKNILEPEYKLTLDVTGQRHRERLFKKKNDYWGMRGVNTELLEDMRETMFWDKLQ